MDASATPSMSPLKPQVQTGIEDTYSEKIDEAGMLKLIEVITAPEVAVLVSFDLNLDLAPHDHAVALNLVIEHEASLSTEVTRSQEKPQATEVLPITNQEVITAKTPMTSPSSVNKEGNPDLVNPVLVNTPTSDLDLMLSKAKNIF